MAWDFIESAPIDGTEILATDGENVYTTFYYRKNNIMPDEGTWLFPDGYTPTTGIKLTHWMPLPEPPKKSK